MKHDYLRAHHQAIACLLSSFNSDFLSQHQILFGGGTRISLELNEYRESVDIDFLCTDVDSYRAARSEVTSHSLGRLLKKKNNIILAREIRADRDAIRTFIENPLDKSQRPIKLEFVHFDYYDLTRSAKALFPVDCIDRHSCFLTKLLANADRYTNIDKKDIIDLIVMHHYWGDTPASAFKKADEKYGFDVVVTGLHKALEQLTSNKQKTLNNMRENLNISEQLSINIIEEYLPAFSTSIPSSLDVII